MKDAHLTIRLSTGGKNLGDLKETGVHRLSHIDYVSLSCSSCGVDSRDARGWRGEITGATGAWFRCGRNGNVFQPFSL